MLHTITILALMAFLALGAVATIMSIGKERKPVTAGLAATVVIVDLVIICGLLLTLGVSS